MTRRALDELKQQVPLLEYLQSHDCQQARPIGFGRYLGLCPLHADHEPSFLVDPNKNLFHCYAPMGIGKPRPALSRLRVKTAKRTIVPLSPAWSERPSFAVARKCRSEREDQPWPEPQPNPEAVLLRTGRREPP